VCDAVGIKSTVSLKTKLLKEIDSIERERDRLRAVHLEVQDTAFDDMLSQLPLAESQRMQLPPQLRARADELHKDVCALAYRCRANQNDIIELALRKVVEVERAFLDRRSNGGDDSILHESWEQLRALASSTPGNVVTVRIRL
jgi:hypothetical protein